MKDNWKMAQFKIRHLRQKNGNYFFQPSSWMKSHGFLAEPLGRDLHHAIERTEALNASWDLKRKGEEGPHLNTETSRYKRGTIGWLIENHKKSIAWKNRPDKTKAEIIYYTDLLVTTKERTAASIERKDIRKLYETMVTPIDDLRRKGLGFSTDKANRVIKWLRFFLSEAIEEGFRKDNPAFNLKLERPEPRDEVWTDEDVRTFVQKAKELNRASIGLAVMLGYDLGQREGDILALRWDQYSENFFKIAQSKRKKDNVVVSIPLLPEMQAILDATTRIADCIIVSEETGRPYKQYNFCSLFRDIANAAGISPSKQFMDLRRSSVVRLSLAGCSPQLISSITGHSIRTVTEILKIYNPPTKEQAVLAVSKLEAYIDNKPKEARRPDINTFRGKAISREL
jgi:integrase